jgi:hypothetical protein
MRNKARVTFQPIPDSGMFGGAVVVHHQVQRSLCGRLPTQASQEPQELLMPASLVTMSHHVRQLLQKPASRDSLKVFARCGLRSWPCQILLMVGLPTPCSAARSRQLHCVIPSGLVRRVASTMAGILSGPSVGFRRRPDYRSSINRQPLGDGAIGPSFRGREHDLPAQGHLLRGAEGRGPLPELPLVSVLQQQGWCGRRRQSQQSGIHSGCPAICFTLP